MSKRLQVLLEERELREIQRAARARRLTVADWVREAARAALREAPQASPDRKLAVVRAAAKHELPTADVERMLEEIERGYLAGDRS